MTDKENFDPNLSHRNGIPIFAHVEKRKLDHPHLSRNNEILDLTTESKTKVCLDLYDASSSIGYFNF